MTTPLVIQPIEDLNVTENNAPSTIDLVTTFDDPFTTGQVARFEFANSSLGGGTTEIVLFDQPGSGAPASVANFLNYVNDGDYVNSIIHRSVPGFIVQGGGFNINDNNIGNVPADPAVVNEFSAERSNTAGTIALAKLGSDENSATNQWFFNLADNSENLDNQNGGFTVFGEILSDADLQPIEAIAELPTFNASQNLNPAFTDIPIIFEDPENPEITGDENFVVLNNISVEQRAELEFEVLENTNPDLVTLNITEGELTLDYAPNQSGVANITLQATDLLGDSVTENFVVTVGDVESDLNTQETNEPGLSTQDATVFRFLNNTTGVHLYTTSADERDFIEANLPNFTLEGDSFISVNSSVENPAPDEVFRFLNTNTGTHLYTTSENERSFIEENLDNFVFEGNAFFAYNESQPGTIPIYRFFNTNTGAHFYTPSEQERSFVEENLGNYQSEGIAYYAFPLGE